MDLTSIYKCLASSNKCLTSSNRCLTSSNKKLCREVHGGFHDRNICGAFVVPCEQQRGEMWQVVM